MRAQLDEQLARSLPVFKIWGDSGSQQPVALNRPVCVIGRQERANLPLPAVQVSKVHAFVVREQGRVYLRDLASTNGVQLNGTSVQEAGLSDEDVVRIGSYTLSCASGFGKPDTRTVAPPAVLRSGTATFPFPKNQHTLLIGRREQCDVRLDHPSVAPVHAILFEQDGKRFVQDFAAGGKTTINGHAVHRAELRPNDELRVGDVTLAYKVLEVEEPDNGALVGEMIDTGHPLAVAPVEPEGEVFEHEDIADLDAGAGRVEAGRDKAESKSDLEAALASSGASGLIEPAVDASGYGAHDSIEIDVEDVKLSPIKPEDGLIPLAGAGAGLLGPEVEPADVEAEDDAAIKPPADRELDERETPFNSKKLAVNAEEDADLAAALDQLGEPKEALQPALPPEEAAAADGSHFELEIEPLQDEEDEAEEAQIELEPIADAGAVKAAVDPVDLVAAKKETVEPPVPLAIEAEEAALDEAEASGEELSFAPAAAEEQTPVVAVKADNAADPEMQLKIDPVPEDATPVAKVEAEESVPPLKFAAEAEAEGLADQEIASDIAPTDSLAWDLAMAAPQEGLIALAGADDVVRDVGPVKEKVSGELKTGDAGGAGKGKPPGTDDKNDGSNGNGRGPEEITTLIEEVAEKADELREAWSDYQQDEAGGKRAAKEASD